MRVVVGGANGRMGQTALRCLTHIHKFEVVGTFTRGGDLSEILDVQKPDVYLDLTVGSVAGKNALVALERGIATVIGATGIPAADLDLLAQSETPCLLVPNFAVGAVLMMQFSAMAAKWLPDVEIIELHHERKLDAPSGTAMRTAELIQSARTAAPLTLPEAVLKVEGARGGVAHDVPVHSVRLRGMLAHQEVIFGGSGEVLTIRHDSLDRSSFEAGIQLCCREVSKLEGFHVGMETLLN